MKLYVTNQYGQKVYLNLSAATRRDLAYQIGGEVFFLGNEFYQVRQVRAETDSNSTSTGAVIGGLVGALGGPVGILIGGLVGGLVGNGTDEQEQARVRFFNSSQ